MGQLVVARRQLGHEPFDHYGSWSEMRDADLWHRQAIVIVAVAGVRDDLKRRLKMLKLPIRTRFEGQEQEALAKH